MQTYDPDDMHLNDAELYEAVPASKDNRRESRKCTSRDSCAPIAWHDGGARQTTPSVKWMDSSKKKQPAAAATLASSLGYTVQQLLQLDALLRTPEGQHLRTCDINRVMRKKHGAGSVSSSVIDRYLLLMGWQSQWKWHGIGAKYTDQANRQADRAHTVRIICDTNPVLQSVVDHAGSTKTEVVSPELLQQWLSSGIS